MNFQVNWKISSTQPKGSEIHNSALIWAKTYENLTLDWTFLMQSTVISFCYEGGTKLNTVNPRKQKFRPFDRDRWNGEEGKFLMLYRPACDVLYDKFDKNYD